MDGMSAGPGVSGPLERKGFQAAACERRGHSAAGEAGEGGGRGVQKRKAATAIDWKELVGSFTLYLRAIQSSSDFDFDWLKRPPGALGRTGVG